MNWKGTLVPAISSRRSLFDVLLKRCTHPVHTHRHLHHLPVQIWAINDSRSTCNCHLRGGFSLHGTFSHVERIGTISSAFRLSYYNAAAEQRILLSIYIISSWFFIFIIILLAWRVVVIFHHILSLTFASLASASFPWLWLAMAVAVRLH